jgi:peptide/nickel transport system substrate-binding protein
MNKKRILRSVIASTAAVAVVGLGMYVPAQAATRSTVIVIESNTMTALNCNTPATNLVINCDISYLTNMGFQHYDDNKKLVKNTIFGSYKIVKNTKKDFRVQYTVAPGKVWSDGTPINGIDLMLQHVTSSTAYAKKAGLSDPSLPDVTPAFDSGGYDGVYDNHVVGIPTLSADKMSITVSYDTQIPDWELNGPGGPYPVHVLELLAAGKTALGTAAENAAAKEKFYTDVTTYNKAALEKMGTAYNEAWNVLSVDKSTNPLVLVGNGAYTVDSAVKDQRVTMVLNPKYNSGPATKGITTIVLNSNVADGSPAAQALANKDIDIYQGQPTADAVAQMRAIKGCNS